MKPALIPPSFSPDTWDLGPQNRWAFQNIAAFLPTAEIAPAAQPSGLPKSVASVQDLIIRMGDAPTPLTSHLEQRYVDGYLILHDGAVVYENYFNGMTPQTPHLLQSVSKSITAIALGRLIEDGRADAHARVTHYLPELAQTAWRDASLRQVMDMRSGVIYSEDYSQPISDVGITDYASGWKPLPPGIAPGFWPTAIFDQILTLTRTNHPPSFHYASIETEVLGLVIERISGMTLAQAISAYVWQPIGAEHAASITLDPKGGGLASGGISCTLRDLARFGQAIMNGGKVVGKQALPAGFIQDLKSGGRTLLSDDYRRIFPNGGYRSQFWVEDVEQDTLFCMGIFGQMVHIAPKSKLVIAQMSSQPAPLDPARISTQLALAGQIQSALMHNRSAQ